MAWNREYLNLKRRIIGFSVTLNKAGGVIQEFQLAGSEIMN